MAQRPTKTIESTVSDAVTDATAPVREVMQSRTFSREQLNGISDFASAVAAVQDAYGDVVVASEEASLGDTFTRVDKADLVGVKMLLLDWFLSPGDYAEEMMVIRAVTGDGERIVFADGSTGLRNELIEYEEKTGRNGGVLLEKGLRVSSYFVDENTGEVLSKKQHQEAVMAGRKPRPATTYYLDASRPR